MCGGFLSNFLMDLIFEGICGFGFIVSQRPKTKFLYTIKPHNNGK